jgi:hypothetical protein
MVSIEEGRTMTDDQQPVAATPEVPPAPAADPVPAPDPAPLADAAAAVPAAEASGWVQPAPAPAAPSAAGSGWVQPAPAAAPTRVEGSGWVQPAAAAVGTGAAATGPAWGQPPAAPSPAVAPPAAVPPAAAPAGWVQPQAGGWVQPTEARGSVTILARVAGVILVIMGVFWAAVGAILIVGGNAFKSITDQFGALSTADANTVDQAGNIVGGVLVGFGVVILIVAIVEIFGGIGTLFGRTFGRAIGIFYSLIFGAFLLVGLTGATRASDVTNDSSAGGGVIIVLVMFLLYLYTLIVLLLRWRGKARASA